MNVHDRARLLVSAAMDFELTGDESAELREHLAGCTACRGARDAYRGQLALAAFGIPAATSHRLRLRLADAIAEPAPIVPMVRVAQMPVGIILALLALALALVVASTVGRHRDVPPVPAGPPAFGTITRIPVDSGWTADRVCAGIPETGCVDAVASAFGSIWATSRAAVVRIDPTTDAIVGSIRVGTSPDAIIDGAGSLWVANEADGTVSRISPDTNQVTATIHVGGEPTDLAFGFGSVWVVENRTRVDRIDAATDGVVATIPLPQDPAASVSNRAVSVDSGATAVWVGTQGSTGGSVWRVDPSTNAPQSWFALPDSVSGRGGAIETAGGADGLWIRHGGLATLISTTQPVVERIIPWWCGDWVLDGATIVAACNEPHEIRRIDPTDGAVLASTSIPLQADSLARNLWEASIAVGDGAFWVRSYDNNAVLRVEPAPR